MRRATILLLGLVMIMNVNTSAAQPLAIPLTVREWAGIARANEPVTTGLPLLPGQVKDPSSLAVSDEKGERLPAQFAAIAKWPDGSVRWLLCDFQASAEANGKSVYTLSEAQGKAPDTPLRLEEASEQYAVTTGPLRFTVRKQGFDLLHEVWVDRNRDGQFTDDELMAGNDANCGVVLLGPGGEGRFTSAYGKVAETAIEYQGPMRVCLRVRGTLADARGVVHDLTYTARIEAFANQSYVRISVTLENPNPGGRYKGLESNFWGLGAEGNVLFRELALVEKLRLDEFPYVEVGDKGRLMLERLPLVDQAYVYQDSSGGDNWYHRNHMNRDLRIPLKFRGYEVVHDGTQVIRDNPSGGPTGPLAGQAPPHRFNGFLDLADIKWGCAVGVRDFWQNFPAALEARHDGTLSVALWPRFFSDDHELMAGEQKTKETLWYFRSGGPTGPLGGQAPPLRAHPPYARNTMQVISSPLQAWAPAEVYLASGEFGRHVPYDEEQYSGFERMCAGAVLSDRRNFATDREQIDEYGWRNFGDVWAANERDQTGGPRQGELMVSHFNLEYDEGFGMLLQAVRAADAKPELAQAWWEYGRQALLHEADIDFHHSTAEAGERPTWAGAKHTHTEHGVEAERSGHAARPPVHVFGTLRWPWGPGGGPESGHWNDRGIIAAYYLTGNRRFLDAAMEITKVTAYRIEEDVYPQTSNPDREAGHSIQILTDAYLLTWDPRYRKAIDMAIEAAHFEKSEWAKQLPENMEFWQLAIYLRAIGRYVDIATFADGKPPARALSSLLGYGRAMVHAAKAQEGKGRGGPTGWASDAMMMAARYLSGGPTPGRAGGPPPGLSSDAERQDYLRLAEQAFDRGWCQIIGDSTEYVYWNAKTTTMNFTGGGEWMYYQAHPNDWLGPVPPGSRR